MRRVAVLVAVLALLAGCGDDTQSTSVRDPSTSSAEAASADPSPEDDAGTGDDKADDKGEDKGEDKSDKGDDKGGHDGSDDDAAVPADAPACAAVWKDGTRLARDYEGCMAGGEFVAVDQEPCSFGQRLVRYGDHFYAVRGGPVNRTAAPLAKDKTYRGAIASCRA